MALTKECDGGMVRIGLFGGTFNPVHIGHLRAAEEIRELFNLDKVIFIPAHISPHKQSANLASSQHRLNMLECAMKNNPHFITSDVELKRSGRSYSVETLRYFKESLPEAQAPFFIIGLDAFLEIDTWKNYQDLFSLCNVIVMTRPGYAAPVAEQFVPRQLVNEFTFQPGEKKYLHASGCSVFIADISALDISSCAIRKRIARGHSVTYLVPEAVEDYLKKMHLYRSSDTTAS